MTTRDPLDATIRAFLDDEAEAMPRRARGADEMALTIAPRVRRRSLVPWFLQPAAVQWPRAFRVAWLLAVLAMLLVLGAAMLWAGSNVLRAPPRIVQIAVDLPLGQPEIEAQAIVNAVRLAVADSGGVAGAFAVEIPDSAVLDHSIAGRPDQDAAALNALRIGREPRNVAVIGPFQSGIARIEIPFTNAAGLLQCSPATTAPGLIQGPDAATRPRPDRPNYVRVVGTDDVLLRQVGEHAFDALGVRSIYVIDGDDPRIGDWFVEAFVGRGGAIAGRVALPDGFNEGNAIGLTAAAAAANPGAVLFTGSAEPAAWLIKAAGGAGLADVPFIARDAITEGGPDSPRSFLALAGEAGARAEAGFPAAFDASKLAGFVTRYRATFGGEPTYYAAAGYACAQVVLAALARVPDARQDLAAVRESVRAAGVDPGARFDTVAGTIAFDESGDVTSSRSTIVGYDAASGTWVIRSVIGD